MCDYDLFDEPTITAYLTAREIRPEEVKRQSPRDLLEVAEDFLLTVANVICKKRNEVIDHGTAWITDHTMERLKQTIQSQYKDEETFNHDLFEALRETLKKYEATTTNDATNKNYIIISNGCTDDSGEYAVGFARESAGGFDVGNNLVGGKEATSCPSSDLALRSRPDHLACLFRRKQSEEFNTKRDWEPIDSFSMVELRLHDTTCGTFQRTLGNDVDSFNFAPCLTRIYSPLGDAIAHTVGRTLFYLARRGKLDREALDQPPTEDIEGPLLPLAIVAAARIETNKDDHAVTGKSTELDETAAKRQKLTDRVRWVSGQLLVPKACGNRFHYSVKDFGHFDDALSVENALSLYLETLLFGLKVAIQVLYEIEDGKLAPALPASGRHLMIDDHVLAPHFYKSPIKGANAIEGVTTKWTVHQGDLFRGKLHVGETLNFSKCLVLFESRVLDTSKELDVLIKVSSVTVHGALVPINATKDALIALRVTPWSSKKLETVLRELGSVLYAIIGTDVGLMTIMADLSQDGRYEALSPQNPDYDLPSLWHGFSTLVKDILLPMADFADVVRADIRPGYNVTSNILVDKDSGGRTMKLIDFESLVLISDYNPPSFCYIQLNWRREAVKFVWWQIVSVAYFWFKRLDIDSKTSNNPKKYEMELLQEILLKDVEGPAWLVKLRDMAKRNHVTSAEVTSTLDDLAVLFTDGPVE